MVVNQEVAYAQNGCIAEMRMLRCMCDKSRNDNIRDERFREHLGVATMGDKIRKTCLRWFEHVQRRPATVPVRKSFAMKVDGLLRGSGRPKRTWMDIDMKKWNLSEDLTQDGSEWRNRIRVADPNIVGIGL